MQLAEFAYGLSASGVAFSPDSKTLVVGGNNLPILWDVSSGSVIGILQAQMSGDVWGPSSRVAFSSDGKYVVATGFDTTFIEGSEGTRAILCIWETEKYDLIAMIKGHGGQYGQEIRRVVFNPNNQEFAISNPSSIWSIQQVKKGKIIDKEEAFLTLTVGYERGATIAYAPDGQSILTSSQDGTIRFWNAANGTLQKTLKLKDRLIWDMTYSPNGKLFAFTTSQIARSTDQDLPNTYTNHKIQARDVKTNQLILDIKDLPQAINAIFFSPDSRLLASAGDDGSTRLWNVATGKQLALLQVNDQIIWDAAFSPDGTLIATASRDGTVRLWGVPSNS